MTMMRSIGIWLTQKIFTNKARMQHGWLMIEVLAGTQIGGP
jgi:hypothetical protein